MVIWSWWIMAAVYRLTMLTFRSIWSFPDKKCAGAK